MRIPAVLGWLLPVGVALVVLVGGTLPALGDLQPVSPGGVSSVTLESRCPTFSWGGDLDAELASAGEILLVVFDLGSIDAGEVREATQREYQPILRERLPSGARLWTPALRKCLAAGRFHAWAVGSVDSAGRWVWTTPHLFVTGVALEGGRLAAEGSGPDDTVVPTVLSSDSEVQPVAVAEAETEAAVHAEASTPATEYGLVGVSSGATGAGLAAENTSGGPDLVLFGNTHSALLSEEGITVTDPGVVEFHIRNSDPTGEITLVIDGALALTTETGALVEHTHSGD